MTGYAAGGMIPEGLTNVFIEHTCGRVQVLDGKAIRCVRDCEAGLAPPCGDVFVPPSKTGL